MAKGLYISAHPVSEADRQRASEYGIDILAAEELTTLSTWLRQWSTP